MCLKLFTPTKSVFHLSGSPLQVCKATSTKHILTVRFVQAFHVCFCPAFFDTRTLSSTPSHPRLEPMLRSNLCNIFCKIKNGYQKKKNQNGSIWHVFVLGSAQRAESFSHSSESTFLKTQLSACRAHWECVKKKGKIDIFLFPLGARLWLTLKILSSPVRSKLLKRHHTKVTAEWTKAGNQWWRANNVIYFTLRAGAFQALHLSTWE